MSSTSSATAAAFEACLARFGTDQTSLVASIEEAVGLRPGDVVIAAGSVVEGLGNDKSDLDLLLIAGNDAGRSESEVCWALGRGLVDLRVLRRATVAELTRRLRKWARQPWTLTELAPFSNDERLLLHRLREGLVAYPFGPGDESWRPDHTELARLKLQVARHVARTIQIDLVGYREVQDYASFVLAAQDLLGQGIDGLLAGHHLTNPNPKWRSRLLTRLPRDWDEALWRRPSHVPADRVFWDLHRAPVRAERESADAHAERCAAFARTAFAWAERRLVRGEDVGPIVSTSAWEAARRPGRALPSIELDVDFFFSDAGVAVARLNEFGASLRLSEKEFALLQLCDGQTSIAEAEALVNGVQIGVCEPLDSGDTLVRIRSSGLLRRRDRRLSAEGAELATGAGALPRLGDELVSAGYSEFVTSFDPLRLDPARWWVCRQRVPPAVRPVVDLFLLGRDVPREVLPPGLAELVPALVSAGLLAQHADGRLETADLVVLPVYGSWLICQRPQANPHYYLGDDSLALLGRLLPQGRRSALDLCAGPGLHAVHCARFTPAVTAVELNPDVAQLARVNALVNGVSEQVEVLTGDLYEPVAGRRFDFVVANPPTLPYPSSDLPSPRIGHGGEDGLQMTSRVLAGLPHALTQQGRAHLAGMTLTDGTPDHLTDWLAAVARDHDLMIRCTVLSHARLTEGAAALTRLVSAVSSIANTDPDQVRDAYSRVLARLGADHLSSYFLSVTRGAGQVQTVEMATPAEACVWHL